MITLKSIIFFLATPDLRRPIFIFVTTYFRKNKLNIAQELLRVVDEVLNLKGRSASFNLHTPLLGAVPELDSMAVVALITTLEDKFGVLIEDDDIDGSTFLTIGSLTEFINAKLAT